MLTLWEDDYAPPETGLIKTPDKAESITLHNHGRVAGFRRLNLDYGRNLSGQRFPAAIVSTAGTKNLPSKAHDAPGGRRWSIGKRRLSKACVPPRKKRTRGTDALGSLRERGFPFPVNNV